ncbi:VanZ like family protein [Desulfocicer vacuolatum DSM 3385]|uniref:VanZ like family protein n=1 Tax=Desulfocicer vacuolatum DSM 3385 TaxID=1121400 RepID=A0A1W2DP40_9BACT|nr:VanZ family protein [Desulfocicer vacuolatum]SMC99173.1 VanZ like family protein [Desulfocicer vacuolatum DSM 3385]
MGKKEKDKPFKGLSLKLNKTDIWKNLISRPLIVLWIASIAFVIISSLIPQASLSEGNTPMGLDKLARIITFGLIAFFPIAFFSSIKLGFCVSSSMPGLGFILELMQKYVPGRHFSPEDIVANNIGAVLGIILAVIIRIMFRTGRHTQKGELHEK